MEEEEKKKETRKKEVDIVSFQSFLRHKISPLLPMKLHLDNYV